MRRNDAEKVFPVIGEYGARALAVFVKPSGLVLPTQKNSAQDQPADSCRMCFRVSERERAAPGTSKYQPLIDAEVFA